MNIIFQEFLDEYLKEFLNKKKYKWNNISCFKNSNEKEWIIFNIWIEYWN